MVPHPPWSRIFGQTDKCLEKREQKQICLVIFWDSKWNISNLKYYSPYFSLIEDHRHFSKWKYVTKNVCVARGLKSA